MYTIFYYEYNLRSHAQEQYSTEEGKEAYSSLCYKHHTATGTRVPYAITQCYLPHGRGEIPAFTPVCQLTE